MANPAPVPAPPVAPPADRRGANLPERIHGLANLTRNLWWSWQLDARELFHRIDHQLWESTRHNAVEFLRQVAPERLEKSAPGAGFFGVFDAGVRRLGPPGDRDSTRVARRHPPPPRRSVGVF